MVINGYLQYVMNSIINLKDQFKKIGSACDIYLSILVLYISTAMYFLWFFQRTEKLYCFAEKWKKKLCSNIFIITITKEKNPKRSKIHLWYCMLKKTQNVCTCLFCMTLRIKIFVRIHDRIFTHFFSSIILRFKYTTFCIPDTNMQCINKILSILHRQWVFS